MIIYSNALVFESIFIDLFIRIANIKLLLSIIIAVTIDNIVNRTSAEFGFGFDWNTNPKNPPMIIAVINRMTWINVTLICNDLFAPLYNDAIIPINEITEHDNDKMMITLGLVSNWCPCKSQCDIEKYKHKTITDMFNPNIKQRNIFIMKFIESIEAIMLILFDVDCVWNFHLCDFNYLILLTYKFTFTLNLFESNQMWLTHFNMK